MFETMLLLIAAPLAISVVPHLFGWLAESRAIKRLPEGKGSLVTGPARRRKTTKSDVMALGYSAEVVDSARRMLIVARAAARKATLERNVEALKVAAALRAVKAAGAREARRARATRLPTANTQATYALAA